MASVCYNCFRNKNTGGKCLFCGYDPAEDAGQYPYALRPGTILVNRYCVGRVLGQGGFGITYVAQDKETRSRAALKEYFPLELASREQNTQVLGFYSQERRGNFEIGKKQFIDEAKTLAQFIGNEHIVNIHSCFETNGTAYFAMEYLDGLNLKQYMDRLDRTLSVYETNRILLPVMEALDWVHSKGVVHRDISPDNIMIKRDGSAKLIDFGAARYSTGEMSKSLDVVLKHGFAPREQYTRRGRQGPFTDVYAMAATYYYAITGKIPPDAIERTEEDRLIPPAQIGVPIQKNTEAVLLKALSVSAEGRFQTMMEFYDAMVQSMPSPFSDEAYSNTDYTNYAYTPPDSTQTAGEWQRRKQGKSFTVSANGQKAKSKSKIWLPALLLVVLIVAGLAVFRTASRKSSIESEPDTDTPIPVSAAPAAILTPAPIISPAPTLTPSAMPIPTSTPTATPTPTPKPQVSNPERLAAQTDVNLNLYSKVPFETAKASSELGKHYVAENVIDGSVNSSWQEAAKGDGIGEYVFLCFDREQRIDMISIWPGYKPYFKPNGRPKEMKLTFSDGTICNVHLEDKNAEQYIVFPYGVITDSIKFSIVSVYEGKNCNDTCITEITAFVRS